MWDDVGDRLVEVMVEAHRVQLHDPARFSVYLAGGFGEWRKEVKGLADAKRKRRSAIRWLDPTEVRMVEPADYVPWDLGAILASDAVFAYVGDVPHCHGTAAEIGYLESVVFYSLKEVVG